MARQLTIALDRDEYTKLAELAAAQDRDPWQMARHLVRAALVNVQATPGLLPVPTSLEASMAFERERSAALVAAAAQQWSGAELALRYPEAGETARRLLDVIESPALATAAALVAALELTPRPAASSPTAAEAAADQGSVT